MRKIMKRKSVCLPACEILEKIFKYKVRIGIENQVITNRRQMFTSQYFKALVLYRISFGVCSTRKHR